MAVDTTKVQQFVQALLDKFDWLVEGCEVVK